MSLREQFEAWHISHFGDCGEGVFKRGSKLPEEYRDLRTQQEWQAYQAGHNESKSHDEFIRGRFCDVVPDLCVGSWEEIWERVRDNFKEKK